MLVLALQFSKNTPPQRKPQHHHTQQNARHDNTAVYNITNQRTPTGSWNSAKKRKRSLKTEEKTKTTKPTTQQEVNLQSLHDPLTIPIVHQLGVTQPTYTNGM